MQSVSCLALIFLLLKANSVKDLFLNAAKEGSFSSSKHDQVLASIYVTQQNIFDPLYLKGEGIIT